MASTPPNDPRANGTAQNPKPGSRNMPVLAWIILAGLVVIAVLALTQCHGMTRTPTTAGRVLDQGAPTKTNDAVMPKQSQAPAEQQPASDQPWAKARDSRPSSPNEEGGTETPTTNGVR